MGCKEDGGATTRQKTLDIAWVLRRVAILGPIAIAVSLILSDRSPRLVSQPVDIASINTALTSAGVLTDVVPLSFADGEVDLLYVGAPGCKKCQNFMADGFAHMVEMSRKKEIDLVYMPTALTQYGLYLEAAKTCVPPADRIEAGAMVLQTYKAMREVQATTSRANSLLKAGEMSRREAAELVEQVLRNFQEKIGANGNVDALCYRSELSGISDRMRRFGAVFDLPGASGFYVRTPQGVERVIGEPDLGRLQKKIGVR